MAQVKAGFGYRLAAIILDLLIFIPIYYAAIYSLTHWSSRASVRQMWEQSNPVRLSATVGNAVWLIYCSSEWIFGASVGKFILRMRITRVDGSRAPRGWLFVRWVLKHGVRICGLGDAVPTIFAVKIGLVLGSLSVFYHEPLNFTLIRYVGEVWLYLIVGSCLAMLLAGGRTWHDRICSTEVVRLVGKSTRGAFEVRANGESVKSSILVHPPQEPTA